MSTASERERTHSGHSHFDSAPKHRAKDDASDDVKGKPNHPASTPICERGHSASKGKNDGSESAMGGRRGYRPGAGPAAQAYEKRTGVKAPKIVAWEITRSCNLACAHCRAAAHCEPYPGELSLEECREVIDDIASITDPILILTGGEPLMRPDIWDIIDYAHEQGLHPVIGTNGTLIDDECARRIAEHGIPRVSVSLDFPTAEGQDSFRGRAGAFEATMEGVRNLRTHGVEVQVNTTVTKMNSHLMDEMHDLALNADAAAFHPFLLVPTGRGEDLVDVELSPQEYEEVLTWAYHKQKVSPMHFKPTDSPQYYRIIRQCAAAESAACGQINGGTGAAPGSGHDAREAAPPTGSPPLRSPDSASRGQEAGAGCPHFSGHPHSRDMEMMTRGCLGGITFAFISHVGDVQPCGYFDMQLGNVKERSFEDIWTNSPVFDDLRHYDRLRGKCGACEYKRVCGGCRARALAATGDYLAEEPYCSHIPRKYAREAVLDLVQSGFPIEHDPLDGMARETGLSPEEVSRALADLRREGIIKRIGASYAAKGVGYVSTLCAMSVPEERMDEVASVAGSYPGVTHNYARENRYNLWFTLIAPSSERAQAILDEIATATGIPVLNMPSVKTYKIRVDFSADHKMREQLKGAHADPKEGHGKRPPFPQRDEGNRTDDTQAYGGNPIGNECCLGGNITEPPPLDNRSSAETTQPAPPFDRNDPFDVELVRWSQGDVFARNEGFPFEDGALIISERLGRPIAEQQVIERVLQLKEAGAIRRFGAIVRHQKMGYSTNAMTAWSIPDDQLDAAGGILAQQPSISHCYSRVPQGDWTANLYGMVHAQSEEELELIIEHLRIFLKRADIVCEPPLILQSVKEYKKTSMSYFED